MEWFEEQLRRASRLPMYDLPGVTRLEELPFTTREDLSVAFERGALRHPGAVRVHLTPHPGGTWLPEYSTRGDIHEHARAVARALEDAGVRSGDHAQVAFGYHRFAGGWLLQDGLEELGAAVIPFGPGETEAQLDTLARLGVRVLVSAPSFAEKLGSAGARVELLIAAGEPFTSIAGRRERVEGALGCRALDCYASSEAGVIALETREQRGLRVLTDWVHLEIVDPESGAVLPDGERGEVVLTHTRKEAMPLVRFRTGDLARRETRADGVYLPDGVFGNVGGMVKVKGVKLYPREVAFWLAGHGLDHTNHVVKLWSEGGADRLAVQARGEGDAQVLAADFQRRFAIRPDRLEVRPDFEGSGLVDQR